MKDKLNKIVGTAKWAVGQAKPFAEAGVRLSVKTLGYSLQVAGAVPVVSGVALSAAGLGLVKLGEVVVAAADKGEQPEQQLECPDFTGAPVMA